MKKMVSLLGLMMMSAVIFGQVTIHYWNFNGTPGTQPNAWVSPVSATTGSGSITHNITNTASFSGDVGNVEGSDGAGGSFCAVDQVNNGNSLIFSVTSVGYSDLVFSYTTRGTGSGFTTQTIDYSTDGTNFSNFTTITGRNVTSYSVQTVNFSSVSAANNNADFKIKITLSGATGATGNNRFDNFKVRGTTLTLNDGDGSASISNNNGSVLDGKPIWLRNTSNSQADIVISGTSSGTLANASITVPSSWGVISDANVSLSGTGFSGSTFSTSSNVITISSALLTNTATGTVHLDNITTPNPTSVSDDGNYQFLVKTAKSGGTLTSLATSPTAYVVIPIANIRDETSGVSNDLNKTVVVYGNLTGPTGSFSTTGTDNFIQDATGGVNIFRSGVISLTQSNNYFVKGQVIQFPSGGLTEVNPGSATDIIDDGAGTPVSGTLTTVTALSSDNPANEGSLFTIQNVSLTSGTWPTVAGTNNTTTTLTFSDASLNSFTVFIDAETDIDGTTEPTWPQDLRGIWTDKSGYGLLPRALTDIAAAGTLPVELVNFRASKSLNGVTLNWSTKTETNNNGFEIEKSADKSSWTKVGFVAGKGTTTEAQTYSFSLPITRNASQLYFRLKQLDNDGKFEYSKIEEISVLADRFELIGNYPNPFNPTTKIAFNLPKDANVRVSVSNILGQEIAVLANRTFKAGNGITVDFNAANFSTGMYFYTVTVDGKSFTKSMTLMK